MCVSRKHIANMFTSLRNSLLNILFSLKQNITRFALQMWSSHVDALLIYDLCYLHTVRSTHRIDVFFLFGSFEHNLHATQHK